ncbi:hypothetical protein CYMTET_32365 [Cymbomonas tetramitiformis]|uniref:NACHT domain-containing protein n=1 Tax=Cymbomonas tetramitiformis TaxID=36881 RepID=A0AAE0FFE8_9CHLO|nr:hypothetical protein CYMTET_32365 [Cymbomonas tetramitiformis]
MIRRELSRLVCVAWGHSILLHNNHIGVNIACSQGVRDKGPGRGRVSRPAGGRVVRTPESPPPPSPSTASNPAPKPLGNQAAPVQPKPQCAKLNDLKELTEMEIASNEVATLGSPPPPSLYDIRRTKVKGAREWLSRTRSRAERVAQAAHVLEKGRLLPDKQDFVVAVQQLLTSSGQCAKKPKLIARLVSVQQPVHRLLFALGLQGKALTVADRRALQKAAGETRLEASRVPRPAAGHSGTAGVDSVALLELHLTATEVMLANLLTVDATRSVVLATLETGFGFGKSLVTGKVDDMLWEGAEKGIQLASEAVHRKLCHECFIGLTAVNKLAVLARRFGESEEEFDDFEQRLQEIHDQLFRSSSAPAPAAEVTSVLYSAPAPSTEDSSAPTSPAASGAEDCGQTLWMTCPGRWEPKAAFAYLLGDLVAHTTGGGGRPLPSALLRRICVGDAKFIGLQGMLKLGLSPAGLGGAPAGQEAVERLVTWALRLPFSEDKTVPWAREGRDLLIGELRHVAEQSIAQLLVAALPVISATESHKGQAAAKAARVGIALDKLRSVLVWVGDTANAALPVCRKTADVLSACSGLRDPAAMSAAAKVQLRRELEERLRWVRGGEERCLRPALVKQLRHAVADSVQRLDSAVGSIATGSMQHFHASSWEDFTRRMRERGRPEADELEAAVAALAVGLTQKAVRPMQATLDSATAALQVLLCTAGVPADKEIGVLQGLAKLRQELGAASTWRPTLEAEIIEAVNRGHAGKGATSIDLSEPLNDALEEQAKKLVECALKRCDGEGTAESDAVVALFVDAGLDALGGTTRDAAGMAEEPLGSLAEVAVHMSACCSLLEHVARAAHGCAAALSVCLIAPLSKRKTSQDASSVAALQEVLCELLTAEGVPEDQAHRYWGVARSFAEPGETETRALPPLDAVPSTAAAALQAAEADVSPPEQGCGGASLLQNRFSYLRHMIMGVRDARDFVSTTAAEPSAESKVDAENVKAAVQSAVQSLKMTAVQQLEELVTGVPEVEAVAATVGEVCGAMVAPAMGVVGSALKSGMRAMAGAMRAAGVGGLTLEVEPVREVAAISMLRVLDACQRSTAAIEEVLAQEQLERGTEATEEPVKVQEKAKAKEGKAGAATARGEEEGVVEPRKRAAEIEMLREELQAAVMLALPLEPSATVRAVLANGELLAAELNTYCCRAPEDPYDAAEGDEEDQDQMRRLDKRRAWGAIEDDVRWEVEAQLAVLEDLRRQAESQTDVFQKQVLLGRCRGAQAAIAQMSHGVRDAGTVLGVVVAFLRGIDAKLDVIATQLDGLQGGVRAMCLDLQRLVGQPVLEKMQEQKRQRSQQWSRLHDHVRIPIEGFVPHGDPLQGRSHDDNSAEGVKMLELVKEKFLESSDKDLLLLSGRAGSGKSTFVNELEHYLESDYAEQTKSTAAVVLVRATVPTLENPLTDLFAGALRGKGLREAQIHELRDLTQAGKVRLIFLLDAYDELKPQFQFKNLYVTNNLEQYGARESPAAENPPPGSPREASGAPPQGPKVIITTRTELLAHDKHYWRHFVPVQVDVPERDTADEAWKFYLELRIASFGAKLYEYIDAKVALELRQAFGKHYGELSPISKQALQNPENTGSEGANIFTGSPPDPLVAAACQAVSAHNGRHVDDSRVRAVRQAMSENTNDTQRSLYNAVAVLSLALKAPPSDNLNDAVKAFCDQLPPPKAEGEIWQRQHYTAALKSIPELTQLATTPFMVKIVTEILPALFQAHDPDASIQANLLLLLTEDAMQVTWRQICHWRSEQALSEKQPSILMRKQEAVGNESPQASFEKLVVGVAGKLKEKGGMLLEQAALVEMLRVRKLASTQALEGAHHAGEQAERQPAVTAQASQHVEASEQAESAGAQVTADDTRKEDICRELLPFVLRSALRRSPVRRAHIYDLFVSMYVEREAQKVSTTVGALDSETVKRASEEFSQQLALRMGCENVSKVVTGSSNKLFQKDSVWDRFVRDTGELGALRAAARHAAPVQLQHGVLTFMHKTIQEYLCASGLRSILKQVLREQAVALEALFEELRNEQVLAAEARGASSITNRLLGRHAARPNKASKTRSADASSRELDALTAAKALRQVEASLMASEWMELDLRYEEAVRDFLTDLFLDNQEFVEEMHFLTVWAECRCRGGHLAGEEAHACDLLLQNVRTLLSGKLASRDGGTLLHVVAADGSYSAVSQLLQLLQFAGGDSLLEQRDSQDRTPLRCALAKQHIQVAAVLEVASMPRSVVEELRCELQEQRGRQWTQLHDKVHIPIEGLMEVNGVFPTASSLGKDLLQLVKDEFLQKDAKDVLLISGPAGSGKSTFIQQLEHTLWKMYMEKLTDVLLVSTSLATLRNPLTDLISEALVNKGLREDQIHELRRATQAGEVRLILLLDGYDELGPQFHFKNLYVSNTLEQYRKQDIFQAANGSTSWAGPKVIIATRTELLVRKANYKDAFLPIEMGVERKETMERALDFLVELRVAPFQKLDQYMHAKVAMDLRSAFQRQMGELAPLSEDAAAEVREKLAELWGLGANPNQQPANNSTEDSMAGKELIVAACQAVTVIGGGAVGKERLDQLSELSDIARDHKDARMVPLGQMAAVFAMALADPPAELAKCIKGFCDMQAKAAGEEKVLLYGDYKEAFDLIPELVELTTTPFTMEIVMEVLPQLKAVQSTETSIKQKLMLILDEFAMQLTWQQICRWQIKSDARIGQRESPGDSELLILQKVQKALDGTAEERTKEEGLSALKELSSEVFKVLKKKRMHLNPKLVQLAQAQCSVHRQAGCTPGTGTGAEVESDPGTKIGMVDAVGKLLEMEKVICDDVVPHVLRGALRRTKVRRSHMYAIFVQQYVERKAAGAGSEEHTAETVRRESLEYSRRLAVQMVCSSVSKVHTRIDSELFHQDSIWDPFISGRGSKLLPVVQKVAPVQSNGAELSFIHKTVQEYLCAEALRDMLHKIFRDLAVDISELRQLQTQSWQSSAEKPAERHANPTPNLDGGQEYPNEINVAEEEESDTGIGQRVAKSEWVQVKLWQEDVVRDFLVDMLIDDADFLEEMLICLEWAERCCQDQILRQVTGGDVDALLRNMRSVLGGTLPKRNQGTLLHVVAAEGSYFAVSKLLEMKGTTFKDLLERRDDEERTPLFCAAQHGHVQVVAALRAAAAEMDVRSKLQPRVQLIATVPSSLIPEFLPSVVMDKTQELHVRGARHAVHFGQGNLITIGGENFVLEHGIVGAPAATPLSGRWRCEVEVTLEWNRFEGAPPDEQQRERLAMGFCIGWSARQSSQMEWSQATERLQDALDPMTVDTVVDALLVDIASGESFNSGAVVDLRPWYQQLGFQLGMNEWSCGLRDTGEWHGSSGVAALPNDGRSEPAAAAEARLSLSCTIGMLIDCDARTAFVSRDGSAWVEHPMGEDMARQHMFPAVSWSGCHGTLAFNFGETPWKCFAAPPGGDVFRPIREVSSGNTPVMEAASEGHMDVCLLLLDRAATEDTGRRYRRTLLHWAAWWGDAKLAARVLEVCPDPIACMRAIDGDGLNAVWHAADRGHAEVLRVLKRRSASLTGVLPADMTDTTSKTAGADFNHVALEGRTPAHLAAEGGFTEVLRVLKEAGANLSHGDNDGKTPAHRAAAGGHAEALREFFLSTDCLRALDGQGRPPVWCAWCWALSVTQ